MKQEDYLTQRVDDQISWYDSKSQWNQKWYKRLRNIEIIAAATIPFLSGYITQEQPWINIVIGILGALIAVIAGTIGLYNFQENWIEYRTTSESLKHEKYLFLTTTEPYNIDEPFSLFVQRVESLISTENSKWYQCFSKRKKDEKPNKGTGSTGPKIRP